MESTSSWPHWVFVPWKLLGLIEAVGSVWQPAVGRAASCAIITGYRSFPDTQLLSSAQFTVWLSQSCVKKNLALCLITREDLELLEFQPACCAWGLMLWLPWLLELSIWEAKFASNLCFNIHYPFASQLKHFREHMLLLLLWSSTLSSQRLQSYITRSLFPSVQPWHRVTMQEF